MKCTYCEGTVVYLCYLAYWPSFIKCNSFKISTKFGTTQSLKKNIFSPKILLLKV